MIIMIVIMTNTKVMTKMVMIIVINIMISYYTK